MRWLEGAVAAGAIARFAQFSNFSRMPKGREQWSGSQNVKSDGVRQGVRVVRQMLLEALPALKPDAHAYIFCHWESWPDFYDAVSTYLNVRAALI